MSLLSSVAQLVSRFDLGPLVVQRRTAPTRNVYGEMVEAAPAALVYSPIHVHNLDGRDRVDLPAALHDAEVLAVYTQRAVQLGDQLDYAGRTWVCSQTLDYERQGGVWVSYWTLEEGS